MRTILLFSVLALSLSGCGMFGKPSLPRRASIDSLGEGVVDDFASRIKRADVIYFPVENLDRAAAELIRALRDDARPFGIAWQDLSVDDQMILDQLGGPQAADHSVGDRLGWNAPRQSREIRESILRATTDLPQLALGLPKGLRLKLQTGRGLSGEERLLLPDVYRVPAGSLRKFPEDHEDARLITKIFAAGKIVTYMKEHPGDRMLVFIRQRDLQESASIPDFVTQKSGLRQLILGVGHGANGQRPRLLTLTRVGIARGLL